MNDSYLRRWNPKALLAAFLLLSGSCTGGDDGIGAHATTPPSGLPGMAVTPEFGLAQGQAKAMRGVTVTDKGRLLVLFYVGGTPTCFGLARVDVERQRRSIVVTVYEGRVPPVDRLCPLIGVLKVAAVRLDERLVHERIVDGSTGQPVSLVAITPQLSQLRLRNGRLPDLEAVPDRWPCPTAPFVPVDVGQVLEATEVLLESLNSRVPEPAGAWRLLEAGLKTMYRGPDTFARLVEHQPYLPDFGEWRILPPEQVRARGTVGAVDPIREVCLKAAFSASWAVNVLFPRFEGLAHGSPRLYFIGRPSGPKLWLVE